MLICNISFANLLHGTNHKRKDIRLVSEISWSTSFEDYCPVSDFDFPCCCICKINSIHRHLSGEPEFIKRCKSRWYDSGFILLSNGNSNVIDAWLQFCRWVVVEKVLKQEPHLSKF